MKLSTPNAALIENAFKHFFPDASVKTNQANPPVSGEVESVTANIQGPLHGSILSDLMDVVKVAKRDYSIYRSGTGLTIKFI